MIVLWRVTDRCNLACSFCAYDRRLPIARSEASEDTVRAFAAMLGAYRAQTQEAVLVSWIGGEPLLWQPVFRLSSLLKEAYGIRVSATTNGTTLHRLEVRRQVLKGFSELTVSVDGFAPLHDALRGWPGGWQRLKLAVSALAAERMASGSACKLRINIVLMHDNLPDFARLCEELADWGIDEITFNQLGGRDRPEFFPAHRLSAQDARDFSALRRCAGKNRRTPRNARCRCRTAARASASFSSTKANASRPAISPPANWACRWRRSATRAISPIWRRALPRPVLQAYRASAAIAPRPRCSPNLRVCHEQNRSRPRNAHPAPGRNAARFPRRAGRRRRR
jgi:MoaA/NifB/PqqE/SkfB family radical SAM enzyme